MGWLKLCLSLSAFLSLLGCGEDDSDPNAGSKESFTRVISSSLSPDGTKKLLLKESGWVGEKGHTQITIEFGNAGAGVYSVDSTGLAIKTYWEDDHHIAIETKKSYSGLQKWKQVQSFGNKVYVRYIETGK